jgi:ABC-2 type transport system ATP-binding protein
MKTLADEGIGLTTIELHRPTLDDVFLTKTGRSLRET